MGKITSYFSNENEFGSVTFDAKHDEKFYKKK
jgi:hypothetical protein